MTEQTFKACIASLSKYYEVAPNDTQYEEIWKAFKIRTTDEGFQLLCEQVLLIFRQTERNPFPIVHNFIEAKMDLEMKKAQKPEDWRPKVTDPPASVADVEAWKNEVLEIVKKGLIACKL